MSATAPELHDVSTLRVERGNPTPEELAGVLAALMAASRPVAVKALEIPSQWSCPARALGVTPAPSAYAWRFSALPRR